MAEKKTKLVVHPEQPIVTITRTFDAPVRLVWAAKTNPEYLKRWYGPHGYTVVSAELDLRVGGAYRIVNRDPAGNEWGFSGVILELVPLERMACTWIFEPMPDKGSKLTDVYVEHAGKTTITTTQEFQSMADREGYLASGAETGMEATFERMDELLRSLL